MEYNKDKYKKGSVALVNKPILYVEGKTSKSFYLQLIELKDDFLIKNGGSCGVIQHLVESESYSYGIVDKDYRNLDHPKLFPINFYSIENVSIIYIDQLNSFKELLKNFVDGNGVINASIHIPYLKINYYPNKRVKDFTLSLTSKTHDTKFLPYIMKNIKCSESFLQYKDLKKVLELYMKYYKQMGYGKINYITDLANYLPSKSTKYLFVDSVLKKIESVKSTKLPDFVS